jgi:hypothetical protein
MIGKVTVAKVLLVSLLASGTALGTFGNAISQEATGGAKVEASVPVDKPPTWQAICGYKWRQHRLETGESGRDAYVAFQRKPSAEGGCGAGETTRVRPVQVNKPGDAKIKDYIETHSAK